jgi:hypothetical protein
VRTLNDWRAEFLALLFWDLTKHFWRNFFKFKILWHIFMGCKVQIGTNLWCQFKKKCHSRISCPRRCHLQFNCANERSPCHWIYLIFWQCAIVDMISANVEIRCIDNMPNQIKVPMLYFHHSTMYHSMNRSVIARMKVPLANSSELTKCQTIIYSNMNEYLQN